MIRMGAALLAVGCIVAVGTARAEPIISYIVRYDHTQPRLEVSIHITGLDPAAKDVTLDLEDWGEWTAVDSMYLQSLWAQPAVTRDLARPTVFKVDTTHDWVGSVVMRYSIPLVDFDSLLHRRAGLLPWIKRETTPGSAAGADDPVMNAAFGGPNAPYAVAFANNVLMRVRVAGRPVEALRTVDLGGLAGTTITTGWSGPSIGGGTITLTGDVDKTPIIIGPVQKRATANVAGVAFDVAQFSHGPDITGQVLELISRLVPAYAASTGLPARSPVRVFITDQGGGQKTDNGLMV